MRSISNISLEEMEIKFDMNDYHSTSSEEKITESTTIDAGGGGGGGGGA